MKLRLGRYTVLLAIVAVLIFYCDALRREFKRSPNAEGIRVIGNFGNNPDSGNFSHPYKNSESDENFINSLGFSEIILPFSGISQGNLVLIDKNHRTVSAKRENTINLIEYTNSFFSINNYSMRLTQEAAACLGEMMFGYANYTGNTNLVVFDTADGITKNPSSCPCPRYFSENNLATCVDIAVRNGDEISSFNIAGAERWLFDNCSDYGFILRYPDGKERKTGEKSCPWHFRYVGKVHAKLMYDMNLCLEEYLAYVKDYSEENPLFCQAGGSEYIIYSKECDGKETVVKVPTNGIYEVSGDNSAGFIVTVKLN